MRTPEPLQDERGIAFPMAMIVMAILTSLMIAFAVLATSETQLASNQMASVQARGLAESGVERALWAMTQGEAGSPPSGSLVLDAIYSLPSPVPSPYDGSTFVAVNDPVLGSPIGGFKVTVANGSVANEKVVTAIGYVPDAINPIATKKITVVVTRLKWIDPVCGLCAGGENPPDTVTSVQVGGSATVNASQSAQGTAPPGQYCTGSHPVTPIAAVASSGTVDLNGTPDLYAPTGGSASQQGTVFPTGMILTDSDILTLKALAKASGPGHYLQGNQTWNDPPPNGLIFVDTPSGQPLTNSSPSSDMLEVHISGNWSSGWSGWLVVAGDVRIQGQISMSGLIYAQNDVTLHGTGNGAIQGAVVSTNRVDNPSTSVIDATDIGNAPISYNCRYVRNGGGQLSQNWFVKPGSYREISGS
jgi:hypothetical protein